MPVSAVECGVNGVQQDPRLARRQYEHTAGGVKTSDLGQIAGIDDPQSLGVKVDWYWFAATSISSSRPPPT
jgi:hypothetical protein